MLVRLNGEYIWSPLSSEDMDFAAGGDDPVTDGACCVLDAVEAFAMDALLFQCSDHALDHAVLLRVSAMGRADIAARISQSSHPDTQQQGHAMTSTKRDCH